MLRRSLDDVENFYWAKQDVPPDQHPFKIEPGIIFKDAEVFQTEAYEVGLRG